MPFSFLNDGAKRSCTPQANANQPNQRTGVRPGRAINLTRGWMPTTLRTARYSMEGLMRIGRRTFLKATAFGGAVGMGVGCFDLSKARAEIRQLKISRRPETRSNCPDSAVGAGVVLHTRLDQSKDA